MWLSATRVIGMSNYALRIYQNGKIITSMTNLSLDKACRLYTYYASLEDYYTSLIVDGVPLTTAEAREFLSYELHRKIIHSDVIRGVK